jgi:hypothetical protein
MAAQGETAPARTLARELREVELLLGACLDASEGELERALARLPAEPALLELAQGLGAARRVIESLWRRERAAVALWAAKEGASLAEDGADDGVEDRAADAPADAPAEACEPTQQGFAAVAQTEASRTQPLDAPRELDGGAGSVWAPAPAAASECVPAPAVEEEAARTEHQLEPPSCAAAAKTKEPMTEAELESAAAARDHELLRPLPEEEQEQESEVAEAPLPPASPAAPQAVTPLRTPVRYSWELSVLRKIRDKLRARACDGSSRWAADLARIEVELARLERSNGLDQSLSPAAPASPASPQLPATAEPATPQPATSHEPATPQRFDVLLSKIMTGTTPVGKAALAPALDAARQPLPRSLFGDGLAPTPAKQQPQC